MKWPKLRLGSGAKPWFFEPQRVWNRPLGVYLDGNRACCNKPDHKATNLAKFVRRHTPHAFIVSPHDSAFMGLAEWLEENTTSVYAFGHFPTFLDHAVFLRDDNDALACRMRWPARYTQTIGDPELDEIQQLREHAKLMVDMMHGMVRRGWKITR
ncbi:MAG: hypothetical protein EOP83_14735 [Verrucomicrobiaceae bacterium]|nr:MAG: hypothetical protein EOP83_14735 [Verrucomicrobiaceae bacterium]